MPTGEQQTSKKEIKPGQELISKTFDLSKIFHEVKKPGKLFTLIKINYLSQKK